MTTVSLETILSISLVVPMDNPNNKNCRWGLPVMLWGDPGIGKSGRVKEAAETVGLEARTVYPAMHQPEDASGIPIPDGKGGVTVQCMMPAILELNAMKRGVLFIDEISCARPAVQGAFLAILYERLWLTPGIRVLAAGNPPETAAGGWALSPPMANRLAHLEVNKPTVDEWTSWLLQGPNPHVEDLNDAETAVRNGWGGAISKWKGIATGFHRARSGNTMNGATNSQKPTLYALPPVGDKNRGRAWPSHRTWEFAVRAAATVDALGNSLVGTPDSRKAVKTALHDLVAGCIGEGQAREFLLWAKNADLPHPGDVLRNGWVIRTDRLDITIAVCSSVVNYVVERTDPKDQEEMAILAWRFLTQVDTAGLADVAAAGAKGLMRKGLIHRKSPALAAACRDLISKFGSSGLVNYVES